MSYKKTMLGSILAFFIGSSCCWASALVVWLGGATFLGVLLKYIENTQGLFLALGVALAVVSFLLYKRSD